MKTKLLSLILLMNAILLNAQNISSIHFDGVDDYVFIGSDAVFDITDNITLEAWIKFDAQSPGTISSLIDKLGATARKGYALMLQDNLISFESYTPDSLSISINSSKEIVPNIWHHIAVTSNGKQFRLYIDGKLDKFKDFPSYYKISVSAKPLGFGNGIFGKISFPFRGNIDEVRIWNIVRDSAQILKAKDSCLKGNEYGLVGYWRLNENKDTLTNDLTVNKNEGILKNGASWTTDIGFKELCKSSGIDNTIKKTSLSLYPNPLTEFSIIDIGDWASPAIVQIFNSQGQLVSISEITTHKISLKRSDFSAGLYFVDVKNIKMANHYTLKFMVK